MRAIANMPGPGGSLGLCALCGDTFMLEILMGRKVQTVEIVGMDKDVCLHQKCMKVLQNNGPDWHTLPEGPLRKAYEKASSPDAVDPVLANSVSGPRATKESDVLSFGALMEPHE